MVEPTSAADLLAVCALGAVGLVLGTLGVLLGGVRKATAWRALLLAGVLAALGGTAWLVGAPGYLWLPPAGLALAWLAFALCRSHAPEWVCCRTLAALRLPRVQAGLLVLGSGGLLCWQVYRLDRDLHAELDTTDLMMELACGVPDLKPTDRPALTDAGQAVTLYLPQTMDDADDSAFLRRQQYELKLIQTAPADASYNCHGWVFTGGQAWIRGYSVESILKDNAYQEVSHPAPGDVAIYRNDQGEVMHTALVRAVGEGAVLLESKWGRLGRYVHTDAEHVYKQHRRTWYRSPRAGHVLRKPGYEKTARYRRATGEPRSPA
jgi:hypothetical protein